jgi:hypothetical protein
MNIAISPSRMFAAALGSACVPSGSCRSDAVLAIANFSGRATTFRVLKFSGKIVVARRRNQHARRVRYPIDASRAGG